MNVTWSGMTANLQKEVASGDVVLTPVLRRSEASNPPLSASLLRRLGEAADGYRTGSPVFIVAAYEAPHECQVFAGEDAAREYLASKPHGLVGLFGPYVTPKQAQTHAHTLSGVTDVGPASQEEVLSIEVKLRRAGVERTVTIDPNVTDALFFSDAAREKFVCPYYTRLYGPEYAVAMKQQLVMSGRAMSGHDRQPRHF